MIILPLGYMRRKYSLLDLIFTESELRVVEGRAPIASNPSGAILDEYECITNYDCMGTCKNWWEKGYCENFKCECRIPYISLMS